MPNTLIKNPRMDAMIIVDSDHIHPKTTIITSVKNKHRPICNEEYFCTINAMVSVPPELDLT